MTTLSDSSTINISDEHKYAILSKLAYENLSPGDINSLDSDFSEVEKQYLGRYEVLDEVSLNNGFQAYWLRDKYTKEIIYTISGTNPNIFGGLLDFGDDISIGTYGMAIDQFISAYNYYQEMTHNNGDTIYKIEKSLTAPEDTAYIESEEGNLTVYYFLQETTNTNSAGNPSFANVTLAGHSLGGHLAGLLSKFTGNQAYVYNAPGYSNFSVDGTFLDLSFVTADGDSSHYLSYVNAFASLFNKDFGDNNVTHIHTANGWDWVAGINDDKWSKSDIYTLYTGLDPRDYHSINGICTAYYAYETIKDIANGAESFHNDSTITSFNETFENVYKAYCLNKGEAYQELDYSDYTNINQIISDINEWSETQKANGGVIKVDSFNHSTSLPMTGTDGADIFYTGGGNDTVNSGAGNDVVYGIDLKAPGEIELLPDNGTKNINLGSGSDTYHGGEGNDIVDGGQGVDSDKDTNQIYLGNGTNYYTGGAGDDNVTGGNGRDIIYGGDGKNYIDAGGGNNEMHGGNGYNNFKGGSNNDEIWSYNTTDTISLGGGNNTIHLENNKEVDWFSRGKIYVSAIPETVDTIYGYDMWYREIVCINGGARKVYEIGNDRIFEYEAGNKVILKDVVEKLDPEPGTGTGSGRPSTPLPPDTGVGDVGEIGDELEENFETAETTRSPLVVDLNGDGVIGTTSVADGVYFDHENDGFAEKTGWISAEDGVLVRDLNGNGLIDNGTELFGNSTILSNNETAANGFEALKELDSNGDGIFSNQDKAWNEVKVWQDANQNGYTDVSELKSLDSVGITEINLNYKQQQVADENGNMHNQISTGKKDGSEISIHDVWFERDTIDSQSLQQIIIPDDIFLLPEIGGSGKVCSLREAMAQDESGELRTLVEQYINFDYNHTITPETNQESKTENTDLEITLPYETGEITDITVSNVHAQEERDAILRDIIYHWAGVQDMDPNGRNPTQVYSKVIDDTRKLEALEEFLGKDYMGVWCWGELDPNPHGKAAPYLLRAFDTLFAYVENQLLKQSDFRELLQNMGTIQDTETGETSIDISGMIPLLEEKYNAAGFWGQNMLTKFANVLKNAENGEAYIAAIKAKGDAEGSSFEKALTEFGDIKGTELADSLTGTNGADEIYSDAGNDKIYAAGGNDNIVGGTGNDTIFAEDGDDVLIGGEGKDYLNGGNGADTYVFEAGFGKDEIDNSSKTDAGGLSNPDIIQFGEGILPNQTQLQRYNYDLIIRVSYEDGKADDTVTVLGYFNEQGTSNATVGKIQFSDGTVWNYEYVITHWNSVAGSDGGMTFEGTSESDTLSGTAHNDVLIGGAGDDALRGKGGNDTLQGGKGNDRIEGGTGDDRYLWNWGDGLDTLYDSNNHDTIVFGSGISEKDLVYRNEGNNLRIIIKGNESQGLILQNFFSTKLDYKIEDLKFYDGKIIHLSEIALTLQQLNTGETITGTTFGDTIYANNGNDTVNAGNGDDTIYGGAGFDTLKGGNGNDILIGGTGNDTLNGGYGDDTYIYNKGDGVDIIDDYEDNSTTGKNDKIKFGPGITYDDLSFARDGDNLIITLFDDVCQQIIIKNQFGNYHYWVEYLEFADGNIVSITNTSFVFEQSDANDNISGTTYNDTIYGNDGNDTLKGGNGNDTLIGGKGKDSLFGGNGDDTYIWNFGDGFDYIDDSYGSNVVKFGEGITLDNLSFERSNVNDSSSGRDLYVFVNGDRNQGLHLYNFFGASSYQNFTLKFTDGSTFIPKDNGFDFALPDGQITLTGLNHSDILTGNNQDNTIKSKSGNDTLIGGKGNDSLFGGNGDDSYIWNFGDGFDYIDDSAGNNVIKFGEGITLDNLSFERSNANDSSNGRDLYVFVNGDRNQGLHLYNFFGSSSYQNFTLKFIDGSTFTPKDNGFDFTLPDDQTTLNGVNHNDILTGNSQDNTINGDNGDDVLIGGKGNDTLKGGSGNDTYIWDIGDGFDYISDSSGNNIIQFGEGITLENLSIERSNKNDSTNGNDLYIFVNGDRNQGLHLYDFFGSSLYQNFTLKFSDGSTFIPKDSSFDFVLPEGQTVLDGYSYADTLIGNSQDNTISGGNGDDILIGGKGNDTLKGGSGNEIYVWNIGDGFDYISDSSGNSIIEFGEGITLENLTFERSNANDSSKGRDLCVFVNGNRNQGVQIYNFFGSSSYRNYTLKFSDGSTFVPKDNGLALALPEGQTVLDGYSYADILTGNSQDNTINGNNGDDVLIGGKGNDTLRGESGNDTYVWNIGDGFDYISDSSGNNIIQFGEGITLENLTFERSNTNASTKGNDLYLFVNGDRNQGIQIYNFFGSSSYRNFTLKFADGTTQALSADLPLSQLPEVNLSINGTADDDILTGGIGNDIINAGDGYNDITGGQGSDTITGGYDRDTYYYNLGDGFDTIIDPNGKDQIIFGEGISKDDLKFRRNGNDLWLIINNDLAQGMKLVNFFTSDDNKIETLKFADNSSVNLATAGLTLDQWDTDDNITGTSYDDVIYGNDGKDTLSGGSGKDILIGGQGNDMLYGGAGNDAYRWNSGDGFDTIEDNSGQNSVEFGDGIDFDDLTFTKIGENLYITINNNPTEGLNLSKFFNNDSYKNFTLKFKDGTQHILNENGLTFSQGDTFDTINGTNFNDVIYANDGNDTVNALAGNDTVYGGKGNDVIDAGNGNDTLIGGEGNDTLAGGVGDDTYVYNLGDGFDTISDIDGTDKIVLGTGITADMLSFSREGNDLRIIINNDKLQGFLLKNQFAAGTSKIESIEFADESTLSLINKGFTFNQNNIDGTISGTDFNDTINAAAGNDTINAGEGDDTITGGLGNDNLNGGNGDDTYIYNMGDGFDTITETSGADKIVLGTGIALENLRFIREGNNLRILINNNVDQGFLLVNQFAGADTRIEQLQFADNSVLDLVNDSLTFEQYNGGETINGTDNDDTIYGKGGNDVIDTGDGDDTLIGGTGNDTLNGGVGRDTYIYNLGDGADTINETRGNDIIKFGAGITQDDLTFTQEGNNLKILIDNDPYQSILINNFYSNVNNQVEKLQFADGSTFNLSTQGITLQQTNADDTVNGTSYNDVIYGNGGHDTINTGEGNDTIIGGVGNDNLNGGNGDDIYVYNLGDGFDTITESGGNDKIIFGEDISQNDLSFEKIGNNLKISINGDEIKGIQINNHFQNDASKVETIEFHDGSTLDISNADQLIQAMNSFSISNSASTDTLSNPTEDVSDMYSLAASQDLTRKAI